MTLTDKQKQNIKINEKLEDFLTHETKENGDLLISFPCLFDFTLTHQEGNDTILPLLEIEHQENKVLYHIPASFPYWLLTIQIPPKYEHYITDPTGEAGDNGDDENGDGKGRLKLQAKGLPNKLHTAEGEVKQIPGVSTFKVVIRYDQHAEPETARANGSESEDVGIADNVT